MTASAKTSMVDTAVRILAEEGYQATSFSAVLARSGAPRGSIYHHFPGGKDELIELALNTHAERTFAHLGQLRGSGPEDIVRAFTGAWRQGLIHTDFAVGCFLLAVTASAGPGQLRDRTGELFRDWRALLAELLEAGEWISPRRPGSRPSFSRPSRVRSRFLAPSTRSRCSMSWPCSS
ncbi:TetR/AcrR family transcriptional regulator [Microbacterium gorillae]|uniref:TetR/AcrR family transcriptional regulator n=1 Tax=Microbacterium gorillae TaxID=1231063 RepID=UPI003D9707D5